jgi:hypothetical protein
VSRGSKRGYVITVADVEAAMKTQDTGIRAGDAVLFHTGWGTPFGRDNEQFLSGERGPGIDVVHEQQRVDLPLRELLGLEVFEPEQAELHIHRLGYQKRTFRVLPGHRTVAPRVGTGERNPARVQPVLTYGKTRGSTAAVIAPAAIY